MDLSSADKKDRYPGQPTDRLRRPSRRHWSQYLQDLNHQLEAEATQSKCKPSSKGWKQTPVYDASKGIKRTYLDCVGSDVPITFQKRRDVVNSPQPRPRTTIRGLSPREPWRDVSTKTIKMAPCNVRPVSGPGRADPWQWSERPGRAGRQTMGDTPYALQDVQLSVGSSETGANTFLIEGSKEHHPRPKNCGERKVCLAPRRAQMSEESVQKDEQYPMGALPQYYASERSPVLKRMPEPAIRSTVSTRRAERTQIKRWTTKNQGKSVNIEERPRESPSTDSLSLTRTPPRSSARTSQKVAEEPQAVFSMRETETEEKSKTRPYRRSQRPATSGQDGPGRKRQQVEDYSDATVCAKVSGLKAPKPIGKSWSTTVEASTSENKEIHRAKPKWTVPDDATKHTLHTAEIHDWNCGDDIRNIVYDMGSMDAISRDAPPPPVSVTVSDNTLLEKNAAASTAIPEDVEHVLITKKEICIYNGVFLLILLTIGLLILALYPRSSTHVTISSTSLRSETGIGLFPESLSYATKPSILHLPQSRLADNSQNLYRICSTSACNRDGAFLSSLILKDSHPCDDFYRFVCGQWKSRFSGVEVAMPISRNEDLVYKLEMDLRSLLMSPLPRSEVKVLSPLKKFIAACASMRDNNKNLDPLLDLLAVLSLEGFPYTPPVRNSVSVWKIAANVLKFSGAAALFSVGVSVHPFDGGRDVLTVGLPESLLGRRGRDLSNSSTASLYHRIVRSSINVINKKFVPSTYVTQVVDFALQVDELARNRRPRKYRVVALREVQGVATYLNDVVSEDLDDKTPVLLRAPEFAQGLVSLVDQTESHVTMNFLGVYALVRNSIFFPALEDDLTAASASLLFGSAQKAPHWRTCLRLAHRALPYILLYASQAVGTASRVADETQRLLDDIRTLLIKRLDRLTVIDNPTCTLAKRILAETRFQVFGPPWLQDREKLEAYVSHLPNMTDDNHVLRSYSNAHSASLSFSLRLPSSDVWTGSALETECWHDLQLKTVYVPMLAFDFSFPAFDDYNSLQLPRGGVRAASCTLQMLFEGLSSHYSRDIVARGWWTHASKELLRRSRTCLQRQYGSGTPKSLLEDTIALSVALSLYRNYVLGRTGLHADIRLPKVEDFGADHLFFIYFALGFCHAPVKQRHRAVSDAFLENYGAPDSSANAIRRLNVTLQNTITFRESFGCRSVQRAKLTRACPIWAAAGNPPPKVIKAT